MRKPDAELLQESRRLAIEEAALMGTAGSARALEKGEELNTSHLADAEYWVAIYSELADFSRELLATMVPQDVEPRDPASRDVSRARLALEIELKLHELHLRYWRRRRDQLRASTSPGSQAVCRQGDS